MFNDEEIIGLADAIDKAVDDYFAKQKSKVEECHKKLGKEDYTLKDLEQKLINELSNSVGHLDNFKAEIELLKVILDYENDKPTNQQNSMYTTRASIQCSNKKD